jgi:ABC-type multidrug transport system fused ATPase/permease subunit
MKIGIGSLKKGWNIFRPFHRHFAMLLTLNFLTQTSWQLAPFMLGKMVNAVTARADFLHVAQLVGLAFVIWMLGLFLSRVRGLYQEKHVEYAVEQHLSNMTLEKYLGLSLSQHRSQNSGITQSVVNKGRTALEQMAYMILNEVIPISMGIIVATGMLLWFDLRAGAIMLVAMAVFTLISVRHNLKYYPAIRKYNKTGDEINRHFGELLRNVSVVQLSSQEQRVYDEHNEKLGGWGAEGTGIWVPYIKGAIPNFVTLFAFRAILLLFAFWLVYAENLLVGDALIMVSWSNQATNDLWQVAPIQRRWLDSWAKVKRYFAVLEVKPSVQIVENPIPADNIRGEIEFKNVSYTYSDQRYVSREDEDKQAKPSKPQLPALIDVSFKVYPGEKVAFVGRSGAGKSTVLFLIARGDDPRHGQILVDGNDLRLLDINAYRESLGVVEQHVQLFDQTMRYNLLFGTKGDGRQVSEEEIERLAEAARINMFRERLTEGWETRIGENGLQLSGGERQRVSIARALAKNSRILLLDEATSNLDGESERYIKKAIDTAAEGRTTFIIAHRLSTVRDADRIYVMDKGRIVDAGRHTELCASSVFYRNLIEDQLVSL